MKSVVVPPVDGVISLVSQAPTKTFSKQKPVLNTAPNSSSQNPLGPSKTSEVHVVHSTVADKSLEGKNKGKGKAKADAAKPSPPKLSARESSQ